MPSKRSRQEASRHAQPAGAAGQAAGTKRARSEPAASGQPRWIRHYHMPNSGSSSRVDASGAIAAGLRYVCAHGVRDDQLLNQCHDKVAGASQPGGAAAASGHILATESIAFAQVLARIINARQILQFDGRTGYGSLGLARALESGGQLTVLEADASIAQRTRAALELVKHSMPCTVEVVAVAEGQTEIQAIRDRAPAQYDMVSLTAAADDATSRNAHFEAGLALLRPGGVMLLHDTLLPDDDAQDATQMRQFHEKLRADEGRLVSVCMLAIGTQGLMAVLKSHHRPPPAVSRPHALCRTTMKEGQGGIASTTPTGPSCPHGDRCNFAHSVVEMRAWRQAAERAAQSTRHDAALKQNARKRSGASTGSNRQAAVSKSHSQDAAGHAALLQLSIRSHPQLSALIDRTATLGKAAEYASPADTVALLQLLVWATGATHVLEVGVFTGVATLGMAVALAASAGQREDAQDQQQSERSVSLIGCELEPKWPAIGLGYWQAAGIANLIDIRLGDAVKSLQELLEDEDADQRHTNQEKKSQVVLSSPDGSGSKLVELLEDREWVRQPDLNGRPHWRQAHAKEHSNDSQQPESKQTAPYKVKRTQASRRYHLFWAGPQQNVPAGWRISRHCDRPNKCMAVTWSEATSPPESATWHTNAKAKAKPKPKPKAKAKATSGNSGSAGRDGPNWYDCSLCFSGFVSKNTEKAVSQTRRYDEPLLRKRSRRQFDLIFIDANKAQYETYFEQALKLLRPGGLIVLDNTLWFGRVYSSSRSREDNSTKVLRRLNSAIFEDERLDAVCMLPTADGITLAVKR